MFLKITQMLRRWATSQNFLLAFIDQLWKTQKVRILKKWKKLLDIAPFYTCVPKTTIIWGTFPQIRNETNFFVILGHFLPFEPPNSSKNENFKKIKKHLEISSFYTCVPKIMIRWCTVPEVWCAKDGGTEKVTYRGGGPPLSPPRKNVGKK